MGGITSSPLTESVSDHCLHTYDVALSFLREAWISTNDVCSNSAFSRVWPSRFVDHAESIERNYMPVGARHDFGSRNRNAYDEEFQYGPPVTVTMPRLSQARDRALYNIEDDEEGEARSSPMPIVPHYSYRPNLPSQSNQHDEPLQRQSASLPNEQSHLQLPQHSDSNHRSSHHSHKKSSSSQHKESHRHSSSRESSSPPTHHSSISTSPDPLRGSPPNQTAQSIIPGIDALNSTNDPNATHFTDSLEALMSSASPPIDVRIDAMKTSGGVTIENETNEGGESEEDGVLVGAPSRGNEGAVQQHSQPNRSRH